MHGHFGTVGVWVLYILGQLVHVGLAANDTVNDPAHSIASYKIYFKTYAPRLVARFFLATCMFPLVWDNQGALNFESFMHSTASQVGISGIFGYFSDSLWDKVLAWLPWLQKKMPQIPGGVQ